MKAEAAIRRVVGFIASLPFAGAGLAVFVCAVVAFVLLAGVAYALLSIATLLLRLAGYTPELCSPTDAHAHSGGPDEIV